jgi:hypothetical protein
VSDLQAIVEHAVSVTGIEPHPEEVRMLVAMYPGFRAMAAGMYAIADAEEELPELLFRAETSWTDYGPNGGGA